MDDSSLSVSDIAINCGFAIIFLLSANILCDLFLNDKLLIKQAAYFLRILCTYSWVTGITNIVTNYFQAIGKPLPSIVLTILKNIVLLIPSLAIMDNMWGLTGVIAYQTIVEYIIAALSLLFYLISIKKLK